MRRPHRAALLLGLAISTLCSCGITSTGAIEVGGPASGIVPTTPLYFVKGDAMAAVNRPSDRPGDVGAAVELLLQGPSLDEQRKGYTTRIPAVPAPATAVPTATTSPTPNQAESGPRTPSVTLKQGTIKVELPSYVDRLTSVATEQLICTAAAARRMATVSASQLRVTLTSSRGWQVERSDQGCSLPGRYSEHPPVGHFDG